MKCMKRQLFKRVALVGILLIGLSLQPARVQANELGQSGSGTVAESQTSAPVEHNRNYVWKAYYGSYTVQVNVNLKTLIRKEVEEYGPCNIDFCKIICSCEEREKFEKYLCENLLYADGTIEITLTNGCGRVIYRYVKPIHQDNRHQ